MKSIKWFLIVLSALLLASCSLKPGGWWKEGVIAVMADSTDWEALQGSLRGACEHVVRTPQIEKTFSLKYVQKKDFDRYTGFRYLILTGTLESKGKIGKLTQKVISDPEIKKGVEKGKYYVFVENDQWARDQLMAVVVGKDIPTLREKIEANANFLYAIFDTDFNRRLKKEMFDRGERKKIEKHLISSYGWNLRIQHDYFLAQEFPKEGFLWFRRMYPERWIFVRWIDGGDTTLLNPKWVIGERNRIGSKYYGGDRVADKYFFSYRSTFLGRIAQITSGLWENDAKIAGGPFKNYTFYDPLSRRVYMIDLAVFAPGRKKMPFLRQLEVIAHSFKTVFDIDTTK